MKVKIFQSGKILNITNDINDFLKTRPQIANVLQSRGDGMITITFFYREAKPTQAAAKPTAPTE